MYSIRRSLVVVANNHHRILGVCATTIRRASYSVSSSSVASLLLNLNKHQLHNPVFPINGLLKMWPRHVAPVSLLRAPNFSSLSTVQKSFAKILDSSGSKLIKRCLLGTSAAAGVMLYPKNTAFAMMDEHLEDYDELPEHFKEELTSAWAYGRKYQLLFVLLTMLFLGWRDPITLCVNILLTAYCTRPNPLSIYLFIEQMRLRDMQQNPGVHNTKFLYTKKVEVEDYKLLCYGKVELRHKKLNVIGILGGWWILHESPYSRKDWESMKTADCWK